MTHPWEKSYPENISWNANIKPKPLPSILDDAVTKFPDHTAIDFLNKTYSYKEVGYLVENVKNSLIKLGVKKGTKVGIYLPNCPYFVISYFAILKAGGVVVNYSPLYSESELEHQLEDSNTEILITLDVKLLYPKAKNLLDKSIANNKNLKKIIICRLQDALPFPKNILYPLFKLKDKSFASYNENIVKWNDLVKPEEKSPSPNIEIDPEDTAVIQYTGGTTGVPKGAELTHKNIYINTLQCKIFVIDYPDGTGSMLTVLPLFHVFAMTTAMNLGISTASKLILHPRFEIQKVLKDIHDKKPTGMPGVPAMYNAINNFKELEKYDLTSLKVCVSGGAPLPVEVKKDFEKLTKCNLIEGYGLTETSPVAACNPPNGVNKEGSIGLPLPDTEILIEDMEKPGSYLGEGQKGELCIRGPQVMKGYYKHKQETDNVMNKNDILKTGDVAMMDEDGYFFIVDRLKEMIICGGFKVYPRHVEEVLYQHPAILEAAVIGVPDKEKGQKVRAYIVFKKDVVVSKDDIIEYCREKLAKHEIPKEVKIRNSLPKSPIGKILKKELA